MDKIRFSKSPEWFKVDIIFLAQNQLKMTFIGKTKPIDLVLGSGFGVYSQNGSVQGDYFNFTIIEEKIDDFNVILTC